MRLDVRIPVGALLLTLGVLLAGYGAATYGSATLYERALGVNVNLWWGLVMAVAGAGCLILARTAKR